MKKAFLRIAIVFSVALAVIAPTLAVTAQDDPVEIQVWLLTDDADFYENELFPDFNAANPDIKAVYTGHSTDGSKDLLRQVINTDAAPDVFFTYGGPGLFGFYVDTGGVQSLDDVYEEMGWDTRFGGPQLIAATWDGQKYAMPYRQRTMGLYYSKSLFEKAGITAEPTTYEELVEVNAKLVDAGIVPLGMGGMQSWMPMRLLDSLFELKCGAEIHDALTSLEAKYTDEPCALEAFQEFKRWADDWMPEGFMGMDPESDVHLQLYTGQAAMMYEGDWVIGRFEEEGQNPDDFGYFYFPTGNERVSWFGEQLLVSSTSQHKEAAYRFLDWVSSPETQAKYAGRFGGLQPTLDVPVPEGAPELTVFVNDLLQTKEGIYLPADQALPLQVVTEGYWLAQDKVSGGEIEPEEAPAIVQTSIDKYLENNPQ